MRSARVAVGVVVASIAACRPGEPAATPGARAEAELERARVACEQGEPGGCDRLELERARHACEAGTAEGCEDYDVARSICLEHPEGPLCDALRRHGDLPAEPPPLAEAFGCRATESLVGAPAVVCLAADRISIRDADGAWEQWRVASWRREDTPERAIRVAELVDGAALWLTTIEIEIESGLCAPVVVRSIEGEASRDARPPTCTSTAYHVGGMRGLLRATLGARDAEAEDALAQLSPVEEVCGRADACERAIAASRPRPASVDGVEVEVPGPPPHGPRTLQQCHARWWSAVQAEQWHRRAVPAECDPLDAGSLPRFAPPDSTPWPPDPW